MIRLLLILIGGGLSLCEWSAWADESTLPGKGFDVSRYETLWTKSPFAVASPEEGGTSPDYSLVGLSRYDGISYASLIDKQSQEHFLLTSERPVKGLTLVSISHGRDAASNSAVIQRGSESITLKLEASSASPALSQANGFPGMPQNPMVSIPMPGAVPQIPMPGAMRPPGNNFPGAGQSPPAAMFRHRPIIIPPQPQSLPSPQQNSPSPTP